MTKNVLSDRFSRNVIQCEEAIHRWAFVFGGRPLLELISQFGVPVPVKNLLQLIPEVELGSALLGRVVPVLGDRLEHEPLTGGCGEVVLGPVGRAWVSKQTLFQCSMKILNFRSICCRQLLTF